MTEWRTTPVSLRLIDESLMTVHTVLSVITPGDTDKVRGRREGLSGGEYKSPVYWLVTGAGGNRWQYRSWVMTSLWREQLWRRPNSECGAELRSRDAESSSELLDAHLITIKEWRSEHTCLTNVTDSGQPSKGCANEDQDVCACRVTTANSTGRNDLYPMTLEPIFIRYVSHHSF